MVVAVEVGPPTKEMVWAVAAVWRRRKEAWTLVASVEDTEEEAEAVVVPREAAREGGEKEETWTLVDLLETAATTAESATAKGAVAAVTAAAAEAAAVEAAVITPAEALAKVV